MQFSWLNIGRRMLCALLAVAAVGLGPVSRANAEMIGTEAVLTIAPEQARAEVVALIGRADVSAELARLGVQPAEAIARVNALSDAEVMAVHGKIQEVPAGESFVGVVVAVLLVTILVLLITDLLGFTDVFSFVNPLPRGNS